ncbi:hypothetical protein I4U23_005926 [Adineta vaga]|nr:hypothetical protein I4U23_005926 [Adineta vaga]
MATNKTTQLTSTFSKDVRGRQNLDQQNILVIWIDRNIDENNKDCLNTITQLKCTVNDLKIYTDGDQCIEFIETIRHQKICIVVSGSLGQQIVPRVHDLCQMNSIFIFCGDKKRHEKWVKEWPKINGVFTEIDPICEVLQQTTQFKSREVSVAFATLAVEKFDLVGILFIMEIDPKQSTIPFASIRDVSIQPTENEVLFSMHSIFRINDIKVMKENTAIFEVTLTLTRDNDNDLSILATRIKGESFLCEQPWERLGLILKKLGQNDKAEEIYQMLLAETKNEDTAYTRGCVWIFSVKFHVQFNDSTSNNYCHHSVYNFAYGLVITQLRVETYKAHQRDRVKIPLKPGVGFPLVQSFLALNEIAGKHLVEVVLVSRNNKEEQVRSVLSGSEMFDGIAADGQVRIAFDGDGVLFSDEAERIAKSQGLQAFFQFEKDRGQIALPKGPMKSFALKLQRVRQALDEENRWRIRTFLVTARNDVANLRVFHTLKEWNLDIDETHFLGGLDKTPFLRAIDPAIYFDDSSENIDRAKIHVPSARVLYGIHSIANE